MSAINSVGTGAASAAASATTGTDVTAPTLTEAVVNAPASNIRLEVSEFALKPEENRPPTSAFRVTADGEAVELTGNEPGTGPDWYLHIRRGSIKRGQSVRLSYTDPTAENDDRALQDWAGNDMASFTDFKVTNKSTVEPDAPEAPRNLSATPVGISRINLQWKAPADSGGARITGYRIEVSTDGGTTFTELEADTGNANRAYSDRGLTPGRTRHYRVSAINSAGTSEPSNVSSATVEIDSDLVRMRVNPVRESWPLKPDGLGPGSRFRLLVVTTNRRNGKDQNITKYNEWVSTQIDAHGHDAIRPFAGQFRALASATAADVGGTTVHARNNIRIEHGHRIYWLNGPKVADDGDDFVDGSWDSNIGYKESGEAHTSGGHTYTGSWSNGYSQPSSRRLGGGNPVLGNFGPGRTAKIDSNEVAPNNGVQYRFFALSPVFHVVEENSRANIRISTTRVNATPGDRFEYTVQMDRPPVEPVRILIRPTQHDDKPLPTHNPVHVRPIWLRFDKNNWSKPQTVKVRVGKPIDENGRPVADARVRLEHHIRGRGDGPTLDIDITTEYRCPQNLPAEAFWKACLTIGTGADGRRGYSGGTGSLTPTRFTYDGTSYTVDGLYIHGAELAHQLRPRSAGHHRVGLHRRDYRGVGWRRAAHNDPQRIRRAVRRGDAHLQPAEEPAEMGRRGEGLRSARAQPERGRAANR